MSQIPPMPPVVSGHVAFKPHRATAVLVLGILSLVIGCIGWIMGIVAWMMANADLREMDSGVMDPTGRGMTQAGKICGMVSVIIHSIFLVIWLVWMVVVFGIIGAAAASGGGR